MIALVILAISMTTRFFYFGYPPTVVFDEVFYGDFLSSYWQGAYFFDQHPPFFKLFMAFIGYLFGVNGYVADWSNIGNDLPDAIIYLRIVPIIAGAVLPLVVYFICRRLNISRISSFLAALLVCFENSLIVQSRFILPDSTMLLVGFSSILFYFEFIRSSKNIRRSVFLILSIVLASLAVSIKWTGLTFIFLIFILELGRLYVLYKEKVIKISSALKKISFFIFKYVSVFLFIYITLFAVHFYALPHSGKGDVFMTKEFNKTLLGSNTYKDPSILPKGFVSKLIELNSVMFSTNYNMEAIHSYSSKWYSWPIMQRSVFYWEEKSLIGTTAKEKSYIYLLGNPFIYWLGSLSSLLLILLSLSKLILKDKILPAFKNYNFILFLILGYLVNLLPFILIKRPMFLYHYEASLVFSIIITAFMIDLLKSKTKYIFVAVIFIIALLSFFYWSPLTYGLPLTNEELTSRIWFKGWR